MEKKQLRKDRDLEWHQKIKEEMILYISCTSQELGYFQGIFINFEIDRGKQLFHTIYIIIYFWNSFIMETKLTNGLKKEQDKFLEHEILQILLHEKQWSQYDSGSGVSNSSINGCGKIEEKRLLYTCLVFTS